MWLAICDEDLKNNYLFIYLINYFYGWLLMLMAAFHSALTQKVYLLNSVEN